MKMKCIFFAAVTALGIWSATIPSAHAVAIYGLVWVDVNGDGAREVGTDTGYDGLNVTVTRLSDSVAFGDTSGAQTVNPGGLNAFGTWTVSSGGYFTDFDTGPTAAATYTLQITVPVGYSLTLNRASAALQQFDGVAGAPNNGNGAGRFAAPVVYNNGTAGSTGGKADSSDFDSDILTGSGGTYTYTVDLSAPGLNGADYNLARIDIGLVPVPEPANVALGIFAALAIGLSIVRHLRARKAQQLAPVVA